MLLRLSLVLSYIISCLIHRISPLKYFSLNDAFYNEAKGMYSKLDMDNCIPDRWRLHQFVDRTGLQPERYPVFIKPEWGQNSQGVSPIDNYEELQNYRSTQKVSGGNYLIQEAARGALEFEVFCILSNDDKEKYAIFSVTQVINKSSSAYPVNGIYNSDTSYLDVTELLIEDQKDTIWSYMKTVSPFNIARFGLRSDSIDNLVEGEFSIFEINLLVPMPLSLLASNLGFFSKADFLLKAMWALAKITKSKSNSPWVGVVVKSMWRVARTEIVIPRGLSQWI